MDSRASVIVTTSRRVHLLGDALRSVLAQSVCDFEVIVVNDCPEEVNAVDSLVAGLKDQRLRVIHQKKSLGANAARNVGIRASRGEVLAFLDDDDRWRPAKLEKHLSAHAAGSHIGIVYSAAWTEWLDLPLPGEFWTPGPVPKSVVQAMSRELFNAGLPVSTVRRDCFTQCGLFDEAIVSFQDWDMWFAIAHQFEFRYVPETLTVIGRHLGHRTSQSVALRIEGFQQVLRKWGAEIDGIEIQRRYARITFYNGIRNAVLRGERREAVQLLRRILPLLDLWQDRRLALRIIVMLTLGKRGYVWLRNRYAQKLSSRVVPSAETPLPS